MGDNKITIQDIIEDGVCVEYNHKNYDFLLAHCAKGATYDKECLDRNNTGRDAIPIVIYINSEYLHATRSTSGINIDHLHRPIFKTKDIR